jgi:hypothetical protein
MSEEIGLQTVRRPHGQLEVTPLSLLIPSGLPSSTTTLPTHDSPDDPVHPIPLDFLIYLSRVEQRPPDLVDLEDRLVRRRQHRTRQHKRDRRRVVRCEVADLVGRLDRREGGCGEWIEEGEEAHAEQETESELESEGRQGGRARGLRAADGARSDERR